MRREFEKKKRHLPIRQLMKQSGNLIQKIKPCFMMSPLSIAQYLDPTTVQFDIIIFDEASQVKPEDALGALLRGRQAIIMGDSKQLPPTSFFDRIIESEEEIEKEDDTLYTTDIESILQLARNRFPTKYLRWHYRSRHESLIAVSNREFYDNKLLVYPSPLQKSEDFGLRFQYLPKTVYGRGRTQTNLLEAREVAKYVINHYRNHPDKSLIVGTFNLKQQQAIWDEIEYLVQNNPDVESLLVNNHAEHFDVKNLETIQGDERDVVVVSVGYGFDENGRLSKNFGPLNHDGGERRLNVLMTRAREKCVIFSNFKSDQLAIEGVSSRGLYVLKQFLHYAEKGNFPTTTDIGADFESPFEEAVYSYLKENGYSIVPQVGCAGFRIDLAIIHPQSPGEYIVGIECDGAQYHSSSVARDRDRLRQQVLENLGWKIIRVWSTDWYRNPQRCKDELLNSIRTIFTNFHYHMITPREKIDYKEDSLSETPNHSPGNILDTPSIMKEENITSRTTKSENENQNICPFFRGIELYDFLKTKKWKYAENWKHLLFQRDTERTLQTVWKLWNLDQELAIVENNQKELTDKIKNDRKQEYIEALMKTVEGKDELLRKIQEERDLLNGIIN